MQPVQWQSYSEEPARQKNSGEQQTPSETGELPASAMILDLILSSPTITFYGDLNN